MLFREIVLHDYARPLAKRKRKGTGPYRWTPAEPGKGRGFYQNTDSLAMDRAGSSFALRLEYANESIRESWLARTRGYYADEYQDSTLVPIIARLPKSRGFLAGFTAGAGMYAALDSDIYDTAEEAARAAHCKAERAAEKQREYEAEENAKAEAELQAEIEARKAEAEAEIDECESVTE